MAVVARKGSFAVRKYRETEERKKGQEKHWELAGTQLGNLTGVAKPKDETMEEDDDYKTKNKYADAMQLKDTEGNVPLLLVE